jgi:murein DD-endopeptidase MepM/ murein hydrolase activator NlpD
MQSSLLKVALVSIVLGAALALAAPDHYGVYLSSKAESKELIGMKIEVLATGQQLAEHFKKNPVVADPDAHLLVYYPDFKPAQLELKHMSGDGETKPVATFVKPLEKDQYAVMPRVPFSDGIYLLTYYASLIETEVFVFAVGQPSGQASSQPGEAKERAVVAGRAGLNEAKATLSVAYAKAYMASGGKQPTVADVAAKADLGPNPVSFGTIKINVVKNSEVGFGLQVLAVGPTDLTADGLADTWTMPTDDRLVPTEHPAEQAVPTPAPASDVVSLVCPGGKLGAFAHGSRCTGYYDEDGLVDIQLSGVASALPHQRTKELVHPGVDIVAPESSPIHPIRDGVVVDVIDADADRNWKSIGYMVMVEHTGLGGMPTHYSLYLHMKQKPTAKVGDSVVAGKTELGLVGRTGAAYGNHVHVEVRTFKDRLNPTWKNIYGKLTPDAEKTFDQTTFEASWVDPTKFATTHEGAEATVTPASGVLSALPSTGSSVAQPKPGIQSSPSANLPAGATADAVLLHLCSQVENNDLFRANAIIDTNKPYEAVWAAVQKTLEQKKEKVLKADRDTGVIETDLTRHGVMGFPAFDKFIIVVEKVGDGNANVHFKRFGYALEQGRNTVPQRDQEINKRRDNDFRKAFMKNLWGDRP